MSEPQHVVELSRLLKDAPRWHGQPKHLALIAGEGSLPLEVARTAKARGYSVYVFSIASWAQRKAFEQMGVHVQPLTLGQLQKLFENFARFEVESLTFAGKINKWLLFTQLRLDALALTLLRHAPRKNDDDMMRYIIEIFETLGVRIIPQVQFMEALFQPEGHITEGLPLDEKDWLDACYGFDLAKAMGAQDVGQTVVVHQTMAIAIEAIEGTDECLKRAGQLLRGRGGCVAKVAKPQQDARFDVPAVGMRTLKRMQQQKLNLLVTEANATLFLDELETMRGYALKHGIRMLSVSAEGLAPWREKLAAMAYAAPPPENLLNTGAPHD